MFNFDKLLIAQYLKYQRLFLKRTFIGVTKNGL